MTVYLLCFVLFLVGLYGILTRRNLIKIFIGLAVMEISMFLFLTMIGYVEGGEIPIITGLQDQLFVDPLPQAMVLTAIVIGLATNILLLSIAIRIYKQHGTFDISKISQLKG
jgi:multicomponent Na+:H+ antiporter subunit C